MPCLNEAETLEVCIQKALNYLQRSGIVGEVLIADNGSTDGSQDIARNSGARVVPVPRKGYGAALIGGINAAAGKYIIMGDADDSYDFSALDGFVSELRNGADLVMGNRFQGGIEPGAMPFLHYYLGNPVLSFIGRHFFKIPIGDFHCGLRGFRKDAIEALDLQTTGMEFASEMIVKSGLKQLNMREVPTTLRPDGRSRAPHLRTWRDGWRHLKFLLIYSPKWLYFIPGAVLTAIGMLLSTILLFGPTHIGTSVVLDLNSFLASCLMSVIGVQIITLGALARYYASVKGMLPPGRRSDLVVRLCKTDYLMLAAGVMVAVGLTMFGASVSAWTSVNFGDLVSPYIPRLVVAGLSLMAIGVQLAFASFFFSVLDIPTRAADEPQLSAARPLL